VLLSLGLLSELKKLVTFFGASFGLHA
jgi:hypothetical protein